MKTAIQFTVGGSPGIPKQFLYQKGHRQIENARDLDWKVEEWRCLTTFPPLRASRLPQQEQP